MTNFDYRDKIAKLLAKAEDAATTPEEAELLTAHAEKLMVKYGIERAMLESAGKAPAEQIIEKYIEFSGMWQTAWMNGFYRVIRAMELHGFVSKTHYGTVKLFVVGYEHDVADCIDLIASLQTQSVLACETWWKNFRNENRFAFNSMTNHERHVERRSFMENFGKGAGARLAEERKEAVAEQGSGTELVMVSRAERIRQFVNENHNLTRRASHAASGWHGTVAGHAAGREAANSRRSKSIAQ